MATAHVSNISHKTSEKEVKDFFSFCGKITNISVTPSSGEQNAPLSATVTFERDSAAKTALLLDNTQLGDSSVKVESASGFDDMTSTEKSGPTGQEEHHDEIRQEDKPTSTVFAEYLSHGYVISDNILQKAMDLDDKHGVTSKFSAYLTRLDSRFRATDKAKAVDETYGVTDKAAQGVSTLNRYFESAMGTPTGQKVRSFYDQGAKQVLDIHTEARRLADLRKPSNCTCGGAEGKCQCPPGQCNCENCAKDGPHDGGPSGEKKDAGPAVPQGDGTTKCGCAGDEGVCACEPGKCSCKNCPK